MTEDDAIAWIEGRVSRETMQRMEVLHKLLLHWQKTINLVAPSTLRTAWQRHFVDSIQLVDLAPAGASRWLDLGSGGGFPGLVVAAMAQEHAPDQKITLVESDIRKCGFMREAARNMGVSVNILSRRIADIPVQAADVISARALSSLPKLLEHALPHVHKGTCLLFPKGITFQGELETLPLHWQSHVEPIPSVTDPDAVILRFTNLDPERGT